MSGVTNEMVADAAEVAWWAWPVGLDDPSWSALQTVMRPALEAVLSHAGGAVDPGQADPSVSPQAVSEAEVERLRAIEQAARDLMRRRHESSAWAVLRAALGEQHV